MIATVVVLGLVSLALVALIAWREREHRTQLSEFADRVQAPGAAQYAAFPQFAPDVEPPPEQYDEPVTKSVDLSIDELMEVS